MKKIILFIAAFLIIVIASAIFFKPALVAFAKNSMEHAIDGSTVSIDKINFYYSPWSLLQLTATGYVHIQKFQYDKFTVQNIKLKLRWKGRYVFLDALNGEVLKGTVDGQGRLKIGEPLRYLIQLNFSNIDLVSFVKDFELTEKVEMTGMLSGTMVLNGVGKNIKILNGNFTASALGGNMTIKDTGFLENMAQSSRLPANIVVDSFKDYHYNTGLVRMFLEKGDLVLAVFLEGATGKRNLKIDLHDFGLK
jgi:hypothetical protein